MFYGFEPLCICRTSKLCVRLLKKKRKKKLESFFDFSSIPLGTNRFEVTLEKSNKNFSKKIQQVNKSVG